MARFVAAWARARGAACPLGPLGLIGLLLGVIALDGTRLDLGLGRGDRRQALLAPGDLRGDVHAIGCLIAIGRFGTLGQRLDLGAELRLQPRGIGIRQRLVLARIGLELGAIQGNGAELQQLQRPRPA